MPHTGEEAGDTESLLYLLGYLRLSLLLAMLDYFYCIYLRCAASDFIHICTEK